MIIIHSEKEKQIPIVQHALFMIKLLERLLPHHIIMRTEPWGYI
jgi:hypothetical protein